MTPTDENLRARARSPLWLCLLLTGCGSIVEPSLDAGAETDGGVDAGVDADAGADAGPLDAGVRVDGGVQVLDAGSPSDGGFCSPCVDRSDCGGAPNLCVGAVGHCGLDCAGGKACPAGSACQTISQGKGPPLFQCAPSVAACGVLSLVPPPDCFDGWSSFANGFFGTWCRGCHTQGFDTPEQVRTMAESVRFAIDLGSMPRGTLLSAAERRRILTWLACGTSAPPGHH